MKALGLCRKWCKLCLFETHIPSLHAPLCTHRALQLNILKEKDTGGQRVTVGEVFAGHILKLQNQGDENSQLIFKEYCWTREHADGAAGHTRLVSTKAAQEIGALRWLNKRGCQHVPQLLGTSRYYNDASHTMQECLIMTKVPGITLQHTYAGLPYEERRAVRKAFLVALNALRACGVDNGSHHTGNVLWCKEENKCYIVDFERAAFDTENTVRESRSSWGLW
ncbi:hypothetical protein LTR56_003464 [Elasticomyces elasticus]|nr:hypothetical protein LTR22_010940 [Elasticomyces elasticus]KAK3655458.1 hypothetical protein LTR56_003464 [Elasticomyces elasticus]KAK4919905.1 hypothetical protein LTR49_012503 [Elasticomyces elasticus]KAK5756713.1 hypothetical protein LTS12_013176 [Elasticomyces elasticus]